MFFTSTKLKWINLLCLLCTGVCLKAQVDQTKRIEIAIRQDFESHNLLPLDTSGIILYRSFTDATGYNLELTKLDTALRIVWKGAVPFPKDFTLVKTNTANGKVYFFFKGGKKNLDYMVVTADPKDGRYSSSLISNQVQFNATEFVATDHAIIIAGYFNFRPIAVHYSLISGLTRLLPGFLNEPGELIQIKTYEEGSVDIVISAKNASRKKCIWVKQYDKIGDLIKTVVIEPEENKNLIFGRLANQVDNSQIVAGVYGRNTQYARGVFVAVVNPFGEYIIHYYDFADLKNFFHYMRAKQEQRIKNRIGRRNIKGKKTKFNYRLIVHDLIPYKDQFVMLGEAFFPRYSSRSFGGPVNRNFAPTTYGITNQYNYPNRSDIVFDGYQYTHAVTIGFDKNANLIWDNSFEINDIKVFQLEQFVKIFSGQDHILLAYLFENKLRTKIIQGDQVVEGTVQNPIKTYDGQFDIDTRLGKLEYWYENYFLVYGVQTVKSSEGIHKVFFINKMRAH
jgi:hypothetical protein